MIKPSCSVSGAQVDSCLHYFNHGFDLQGPLSTLDYCSSLDPSIYKVLENALHQKIDKDNSFKKIHLAEGDAVLLMGGKIPHRLENIDNERITLPINYNVKNNPHSTCPANVFSGNLNVTS